jgi:hypothetical protein
MAVFEIARPPEQVLAQAKHVAQVLTGVIAQTNAEVTIAGRKHLKIEGWLTLGSFYGITPRTIETRYVEVGGAHGYEATAQAVHVATGTVLSQQDGMCLNDEPNWHTRPKYEWKTKNGQRVREKIGDEPVTHQQRRSMAATRAQSKAMSIPLRWIAVLAGYQATPAEEMQGNEYGEEAPPIQQPQRAQQKPGAITQAQAKRLHALKAEHHWSDDELKAVLAEYGYGSTKDIARENYEVICNRVEAGDKAAAKAESPWRTHFTAEQQPAVERWLKSLHVNGDEAIEQFFAKWEADWSDAAEEAARWLEANKQGSLGV